MKTINPQFAAHLEGSVTTICRCWKISRTDGEILGFTEHDNSIFFDATNFQPMSGMDSTVAEASMGLNADSVEVLGALTSQKLDPLDIRANKYDGARVEVFSINWADPTQYLLENVYTVGEITEEDGLFRAELRTLESELDQTQGEHYIRQCQANLGDARCKVDISLPIYRGQGSILAYDGLRTLGIAGLQAYAAGWFDGGRLTWTSGDNTGVSIEISQHTNDGTNSNLEIWKMMPSTIAIGDTFDVTAGCDKGFHTCKSKFANPLNFRGFPHLPGNDFALTYASNSHNLDGGVLVE